MLELHERITKIIKNKEFNVRIRKSFKKKEFHARLTKILKIMKFHWRIIKIIKKHIISFENHVNQINRKIPNKKKKKNNDFH